MLSARNKRDVRSSVIKNLWSSEGEAGNWPVTIQSGKYKMEGWSGGPRGRGPTSDGRVEKDLLEQKTVKHAFKMEEGMAKWICSYPWFNGGNIPLSSKWKTRSRILEHIPFASALFSTAPEISHLNFLKWKLSIGSTIWKSTHEGSLLGVVSTLYLLDVSSLNKGEQQV